MFLHHDWHAGQEVYLMKNKCSLDDPTKKGIPEIYACPQCGDEVEIWSDEKVKMTGLKYEKNHKIQGHEGL